MAAQSIVTKFNRAVQLEKAGDHDKALREYVQIITDDPSFRSAHLNLGSLYSRMNKLPEAMKCFEDALSLKADYIAYFNIGSIFYKMGMYANALINLEKASSLNDTFTLSVLIAGLSHSRLKNLPEAEKCFNKVLRYWPDNRIALTALAIICYNTDRFEDSLRILNALLQIDAGNINIRKLKSTILLKIGRFNESATEIKIIKRKAGGYKYFDEYIKSISIESLTDKYGTIDDKIEILHERIKEDATSLISLSLCHLLKGDTDAAIDYLFKYKKK